MKPYERVYASVNLDAILANCKEIKQNIASNTQIVAVIKTDGYGHGAIPIAGALQHLEYLYGFAVATLEEALQLRASGIDKPILLLGYTFPSGYEDLVREDIIPCVFRLDSAIELSKIAAEQSKVLKVHIKVDTGMSRIGIFPNEEGLEFVKQVSLLPGIAIDGIFTHFAKADEVDKTDAFRQLHEFLEFIKEAEARIGYRIPFRHCANSAAIIDIPEANLDLVRPGIALYGLWPSQDVNKERIQLTPAMELKSTIVLLKEINEGRSVSYGGLFTAHETIRIATIPVGYGDGYPRALSNVGYVLIHGQKAPIKGRICMDQFMVDVSHIPEVKMGNIATLIGTDQGETITMEELGELSGRFNYELACDLTKRIPRVYYKEQEIVTSQDYFEYNRKIR